MLFIKHLEPFINCSVQLRGIGLNLHLINLLKLRIQRNYCESRRNFCNILIFNNLKNEMAFKSKKDHMFSACLPYYSALENVYSLMQCSISSCRNI